jgi:hypothetical protein
MIVETEKGEYLTNKKIPARDEAKAGHMRAKPAAEQRAELSPGELANLAISVVLRAAERRQRVRNRIRLITRSLSPSGPGPLSRMTKAQSLALA